MNTFNLASRNLLRNWQKSAISISAMAFAGAVMILFAALMEGMLQSIERNAVTMTVGEFQIHSPGYRDDPDLYNRIEFDQSWINQFEQRGLYSSARLFGFGLAAAGSSSAGVQLRGINPKQEKNVTKIHQHVMEGTWLDTQDPSGVVIGKKLARTLNVKLNDEVVLLSQAADGSMADALFQVRGILKSVGEDIDRGGFFMVDSRFLELMVIDSGYHEIVLQRMDLKQDSDVVDQHIKTIISERGFDWQVSHWRQTLPTIARMLDMADGQMLFMILITYVAVAMVVLNSMLMSVFERIREFGVMKALGVSPQQLMLLIYIESAIQTLIASVIALLLGAWIAIYFQNNGIDLTSFGGGASIGGVAMDTHWKAALTPEAIIRPLAFLFIMVTVAVLYPATKAAFLRPVEAINFR